MILLFWAQGIDILRRLSEQQLEAIPGLKKAIDAVSGLPDVIGWGEEPRGTGKRPKTKQARKSEDKH